MPPKKNATKRKPSSKGVSALKTINKLAKEIQKKHPGKKWPTCIKEASAQYRKDKK